MVRSFLARKCYVSLVYRQDLIAGLYKIRKKLSPALGLVLRPGNVLSLSLISLVRADTTLYYKALTRK